MDLKIHRLAHVRYTRATDLGEGTKGDVTERVIIPTYIPGDAIKALDLSHLSETDALAVQELVKEYAEYLDRNMRTLFNLEDFIAQTHGPIPGGELKHRTFKRENIDVIVSE